jgi:PAT family beta-lactamase induction signal transducer AmpG
MPLPLPNLLATRRGRLIAFFLLYVTEGIPLGFVATAVATQLRRMEVGPAEIGALVGSFYLPWGFKWIAGPVVDAFGWARVGHRRGWIILTQVLMALTLLSTLLVPLPSKLWLFTIVLLIHNSFGAIQDVAIDALACNTLGREERGLANGMMFAGAYTGQMLGGAGVLLLSGLMPFQATYFVVAGLILAVTVCVVLPMREPPMAARTASGSRLRAIWSEIHDFSVQAFSSFLGTRGAFAGVVFSLLPAGAMCLGLAIQSSLAVEFGMDDDEIGVLNLVSTIVSAIFCVTGGVLSDRFGRRKMLGIYFVLLSVPVVMLIFPIQAAGWIYPASTGSVGPPYAPSALLWWFWVTSIVYACFQGLMYGTRSAIMMDITNPKVAGTQFTAYMALANVAIAYSASWTGRAAEAWGYPAMMRLDVVLGLLCLLVLPFLRPSLGALGEAIVNDGRGAIRARAVAVLLAVGCVGAVIASRLIPPDGGLASIANTFFTLTYVLSGVFLLAGGATIGGSAPMLARTGAWFAPLLIAMSFRAHSGAIVAFLGGKESELAQRISDAILLLVPLLGAALLVAFATRSWKELTDGQERDSTVSA